MEPFVFCAEKADKDEFGGAAFAVDSIKDLELVASLSHESTIRDLDAPGGGQIITLRDPVNRFPFHFVYGQVQSSYETQKDQGGLHPFNYVRL